MRCRSFIHLDVTDKKDSRRTAGSFGNFLLDDSSIVLPWLTNPHTSFKVFVSNRIFKIHQPSPNCEWAYVRTEQNPANCVSRGLTPSDLQSHLLYWSGPEFLFQPISEWNLIVPSVPMIELPELWPTSLVACSVEPIDDWLTRFSSYGNLLRVVAWMRRFVSRSHSQTTNTAFLTRNELDEALVTVIKSTQNMFYPELIRELKTRSVVHNKGLARLSPFLDDKMVIRVGGRLRNSNLRDDRKHPILLPKNCHLALLTSRYWHVYICHAGPRFMTAMIHKQFWIVSVRQVVHHVLRQCTVCVRLSAKHPQPIMANLPSSRVQPCKPFSKVGVDYAGPIKLKETRLRKSREYKVYIAIFVYMSVKAVHLELVLDLTSEAFLAALDRFTARRGVPTDIYSDCGTNFVGASKELYKLVHLPSNQEVLASKKMCRWHFNPPSAPHFGGIWEAAVHSAKHLMIRTVGNHVLTLEEMSTILCRIEAALNSIPLTELSTDPHDLDCLTPGHFLIGQLLLAIPEEDLHEGTLDLRRRWKLLHQYFQNLWKRWSLEYLHQLQVRSRWIKESNNLVVNQMVLIKDDSSPPLTWRMGRITELLPGADGVVRVVKVITKSGVLTRPVVKLILLPID